MKLLKITTHDFQLLFPIVAANGIGFFSIFALPMLVAAYVSGLGLDEQQATMVGSVEIVSSAFGAFTAAPYLSRHSPRGFALAGALLVVISNLIGSAVDSVTVVVFLRAVAGFAAGMVLGAGNALLSSTKQAERIYALALIGSTLVAALLMWLLPYAVSSANQKGVFVLLAAFTVLLTPLLFLINKRPIVRSNQLNRESGKLANIGFGISILIATVVFRIGEGAVWTVLEFLGEESQLDIHSIGKILSGTIVTGLLGAGGAAALGKKLGQLYPIWIGIIVVCATVMALSNFHNPGIYVVAVLLESLAFYFVLPYLIGLFALLDQTGRWVAIGSGAIFLGLGIGPMFGGVMVKYFGYGSLGWTMLLSGIVTVSLASYVVANLEKSERKDLSSPTWE